MEGNIIMKVGDKGEEEEKVDKFFIRICSKWANYPLATDDLLRGSAVLTLGFEDCQTGSEVDRGYL